MQANGLDDLAFAWKVTETVSVHPGGSPRPGTTPSPAESRDPPILPPELCPWHFSAETTFLISLTVQVGATITIWCATEGFTVYKREQVNPTHFSTACLFFVYTAHAFPRQHT